MFLVNQSKEAHELNTHIYGYNTRHTFQRKPDILIRHEHWDTISD